MIVDLGRSIFCVKPYFECKIYMKFSLPQNHRCLLGAVSSGNYNVGFVYMSEMFAPKHRSVVGNVVNVVWSVATAVLPGLALLIPNWRWLVLAISLPNFATIPWIFFFPGSKVTFGDCVFRNYNLHLLFSIHLIKYVHLSGNYDYKVYFQQILQHQKMCCLR